MSKTAPLIAALVCLVFASSAPSQAQDVPNFFPQDAWQSANMSSANYTFNLQMSNERNARNQSSQWPERTRAPTPPQLRANSEVLKFVPSASRRRAVVADYLAHVRRVAPEAAPAISAEMNDGSAFIQYARLLSGVGLDANNVADNLAVWLVTAWEASAGRPVETPPEAFVEVKRQIQNSFSQGPLASMSNSDKQTFSDNLMIHTLILANQIEQAKSDSSFARQLAAGTKQGAQRFGFNLETMYLTPKGFVLR